MNIFFASNDAYAMQTCVSIASLLKNYKSNERLHVFVYDFGLSDENRRAIEHLKKQIRDFDIEFQVFDKSLLSVFNVGKWSPIIRLKLFADKLFPDCDRVMWLNGNNIIRGDIGEIYNLDLTNKYYAVATCNILGRVSICDCLVVYNLKTMRQYDVFNKIIDIVKQVEKKQKAYAGEYALGQIDSIQKLDERYFASVDMSDYRHEYVSPKSIVIKYSERNGFSPWQVPRELYPELAKLSYDEWHQYCELTDYRGLINKLADIPWLDKIKQRYIRAKRCFLVDRRIKTSKLVST